MKRLLICLLLAGCNVDIEQDYPEPDATINHGEFVTLSFFEDAEEVLIKDMGLTFTDNDGYYLITIPAEYLANKCGRDYTSRLIEYYPKVDGKYETRKSIAIVRTYAAPTAFDIPNYWHSVSSGSYNPLINYVPNGNLSLFNVRDNEVLDIDNNGNIDVIATSYNYHMVMKSDSEFSCQFVIQNTGV